MANENKLKPQVAPSQEVEIKIGAEFICDNFEAGGDSVIGKVLGVEKEIVRLRIESLGRDWLVNRSRFDFARQTWQHVAADYPALGEKADFDKMYRPSVVSSQDPGLADKIAQATEALTNLLPEDVRRSVQSAVRSTAARAGGGPENGVLARWVGHGKIDCAYVTAGTREMKRGAETGTEGFFPRDTVEKYKKRGKEQRVQYFVEL